MYWHSTACVALLDQKPHWRVLVCMAAYTVRGMVKVDQTKFSNKIIIDKLIKLYQKEH
jgi:7,8-dihydro-6-hydroxymethylpterin-pyrophosphokinase